VSPETLEGALDGERDEAPDHEPEGPTR
jgi:hypothetical protein